MVETHGLTHLSLAVRDPEVAQILLRGLRRP